MQKRSYVRDYTRVTLTGGVGSVPLTSDLLLLAGLDQLLYDISIIIIFLLNKLP